MKHPTPNSHGVAAAHWAAAGEGRLALPYCEPCARYHWPPRGVCPHCGSGTPTWRDASGRGMLVTWSIVHRPVNPALKEDVPYAVAFVELDEGVRLFSNVVGTSSTALFAGMRVRCRFEEALDPGVYVPVFEVAE